MKKSLIALAVAGAFAAPAFAATSNVDVYGKMHASVNLFNDVAAGVSDVGISSNASRLGFKGTEDLGGGLKGVWQIESGVNIDEQNGGVANRNSFLGVAGGFGTFLLGNHDTPLKLVGRKVDLFGDTLADSRNILGGGSDGRAQNVAAYVSPNFSGFSFIGALVSDFNGNAGADDNTNDAYNMSFNYENGPLYVGLGYGDGGHHSTNALKEHWRLAGSYAIGDLKLVAQYDDLGGIAAGTDFDGWMIGAQYNMGPVALKASYITAEMSAAGAVDTTQWTLGVDYSLSKRTSVYALYVAGENLGVAGTNTRGLGGGAGASDTTVGAVVPGDDDVSAFSIGIVHNF